MLLDKNRRVWYTSSMINDAMFSSLSGEWETPDWLFEYYDKIFKFNVDVCATEQNRKCSYFSLKDNSLTMDWPRKTCWMNPPYGKNLTDWIDKANYESLKGSTVVALLPARTDTRWFHDIKDNPNTTIRLFKGRLKFKGAKSSAPFPSMIVIFWPTMIKPKNTKGKL